MDPRASLDRGYGKNPYRQLKFNSKFAKKKDLPVCINFIIRTSLLLKCSQKHHPTKYLKINSSIPEHFYNTVTLQHVPHPSIM
jgi:hypothetical protein